MITARATGSVGRRAPRAPAFVLQPGVGQRGQHDVAMPADKRAALEVIEPEFVFQFFVLLFDRPAVMRQADQRRQRRRRRADRPGSALMRGVVPRSRSKSSQTSGASRRVAPVVRRRDAQRGEVGRPRPVRPVAPRDAAPGPRRQPAAMARTASGRGSSVSAGATGGRLRPGVGGGTATRGVPRKTVSVDEMPSAYGSSSDAACGAAWRCRRIRHRRAPR